jgi:hypothetical protein
MVPGGSKIVSALMRHGRPSVYVEKVTDSKSDVPMIVVFVGTDEEFTAWGLDHIASLNDGVFVWHVYGKIDHG